MKYEVKRFSANAQFGESVATFLSSLEAGVAVNALNNASMCHSYKVFNLETGAVVVYKNSDVSA